MGVWGNDSDSGETLKTCYNVSDTIVEDTIEPNVNVTFFLLLVLCGLTIFTNALILAAFYVEKKLRTYTNCYILNIAIADLVVGLVCMPLRATIFLYSSTWTLGKIPGILFLGFQNSIMSVSVFGVIVICIDRYVATFYPIKHFQKRSIRKATIANILTWVSSFGVWMMVTSVWDFISPVSAISPTGFSHSNYALTKTASILVSIFRATGPFLIMIVLYLRIYYRVRNIGRKRFMAHLGEGQSVGHQDVSDTKDSSIELTQGRPEAEKGKDVEGLKQTATVSSVSLHVYRCSKHSEQFGTDEGGQTSGLVTDLVTARNSNEFHILGERTVSFPKRFSKKRLDSRSAESRKALRTLTFIIIAFFATWVHRIVNLMIFTISPNTYEVITDTVNFREVSIWIAYSNSLVNPLAYAMAQPLIRQTILKILHCRKCSLNE